MMGNDFNIIAAIGLVLRVLSIGIILFYLLPKAFAQVLRPKDWLTGLRWQLLGMFVFVITASVPTIIYQILLSSGLQSELLRNIVTITGNLSFLGFAVLLVMIYNYRKKE